MTGVPFSLKRIIEALREKGTAFSRTTDRRVPLFTEVLQQVLDKEDWPTKFIDQLTREVEAAADDAGNQVIYKCAGENCSASI